MKTFTNSVRLCEGCDKKNIFGNRGMKKGNESKNIDSLPFMLFSRLRTSFISL